MAVVNLTHDEVTSNNELPATVVLNLNIVAMVPCRLMYRVHWFRKMVNILNGTVFGFLLDFNGHLAANQKQVFSVGIVVLVLV